MIVINFILSLFKNILSFFFTLEVIPGVSFGYVFIVGIIFSALVKFFLKGDNDG